MLDTAIPDDPFSKRLQRICQLIAQGKLHDAATQLNAAQKEAPADARIPLIGMRMADAAGNLKGAIQMARRALELAPGWPVVQVELAQLLARMGGDDETREALELARQARAADPDHVQLAIGAINAAHAAHDAELALQWAEEVLERHPGHGGLQLFAGQMLILLGREAEAMSHLQLAQNFARDFAPHQKKQLLAAMRSSERALGDEAAAQTWAGQELIIVPERIAELSHEKLSDQHASHPVGPLLTMLQSAHASGSEATAQMWADQALAIAPEDGEVRYWHAIVHGHTPATQPAAVVQALFDHYPADYDRHMVGTLHYRAPDHIVALLREKFPDLNFNLLDLGCGTGFVGMCLGRIQGHIMGVDLSQALIDQAARRGVYSRFHRINLIDALAETPSGHYEAITCADTLPYVGDLTPVIPNARRVLKPSGWFLFTCEAARPDEGDPSAYYVLRPTNRYAHRAEAVERQLHEAGFVNVVLELLSELRREGDAPLAGFLAVAQKPEA